MTIEISMLHRSRRWRFRRNDLLISRHHNSRTWLTDRQFLDSGESHALWSTRSNQVPRPMRGGEGLNRTLKRPRLIDPDEPGCSTGRLGANSPYRASRSRPASAYVRNLSETDGYPSNSLSARRLLIQRRRVGPLSCCQTQQRSCFGCCRRRGCFIRSGLPASMRGALVIVSDGIRLNFLDVDAGDLGLASFFSH